MQSIAEQIHQADSELYFNNMRKLIERMGEREKLEFMGYLNSAGAVDIAKEIFGIDSFVVMCGIQDIYIPHKSQLYMGSQRDTGGIEMNTLSKNELELLLQAFFKNTDDRDYIINLIFYKNNFIKKTQGNILDYLEKVESLFQKVGNPKKKILKIVKNDTSEYAESANDNFFVPVVDRIENMEPGYFDYINQVYVDRLEYVESLFCETIASLAEDHRNHIWALDPENNHIYIPEILQAKISLIRSICEFHKIIDPDFPMLHTLVESTLASWILIYRGFSAPTYSIRKILGVNNH